MEKRNDNSEKEGLKSAEAKLNCDVVGDLHNPKSLFGHMMSKRVTAVLTDSHAQPANNGKGEATGEGSGEAGESKKSQGGINGKDGNGKGGEVGGGIGGNGKGGEVGGGIGGKGIGGEVGGGIGGQGGNGKGGEVGGGIGHGPKSEKGQTSHNPNKPGANQKTRQHPAPHHHTD